MNHKRYLTASVLAAVVVLALQIGAFADAALPAFAPALKFSQNGSIPPAPQAVSVPVAPRSAKESIEQVIAEKIKTAPALAAAGFSVPEGQKFQPHLNAGYAVPVIGWINFLISAPAAALSSKESMDRLVEFNVTYQNQYAGTLLCHVALLGGGHGQIGGCFPRTPLSDGQAALAVWPVKVFCPYPEPQDCSQDVGGDGDIQPLSFDGGQSPVLVSW